jgi:DNA polymerase III sliding clamp (beta) subunit (PCNA family)
MFLSDNIEPISIIPNQVSTQLIKAEFEKEKLVNALHAVSAAQIDTDIGWIQISFTGQDKIIFSSTSHNLSLQFEMFSKHEGIGHLKVSGRQFSEYIKQLPNSTIYLKAELPYRMHLKCAGSSAKIQLIQDSTVNQVIPAKAGTNVLVKGIHLEKWISSFKDLILVDDSRFYANGALIWLDSTENQTALYSVASDALRLSQSCLTEIVEPLKSDNSKVIVPKKVFEELKREAALYPDKNFSLKWNNDELSFSAECEGYLLFCKCIAGIYPPYEAAFPKKINSTIEFDLKLFQESVKRSLIFADKNKVMRLYFENALLKMSSISSGQKEGEEVIEIHPQLESQFEVNYNGPHLSGILNILSGSRVRFSWESVNKPVKIEGEEQVGLNVFYLIVPTRC